MHKKSALGNEENTAFLIFVLLFISNTNLLHSFEVQLAIEGIPFKLKDILLRYHSPLNNVPSLITLTNVGWFDLIKLANVLTEGKIINNSLKELYI